MPRPARSVETQRRAKGRVDRPAFGIVAIAGFFTVLMFGAALQGQPTFTPIDQGDRSGFVLPPETAQPTPGTPLLPEQTDSPVASIIGTILAILIGLAVLVFVFFAMRALVRFLRDRWRSRPLARKDAADVQAGAAAVNEAVERSTTIAIQRGIARALDIIQSGAEPGDSIIAAWVGLEESASDAGMARGRTETPAEFTVRILSGREGISGEITALLALYESVRFGGRIADEKDRRAASSHLHVIDAEWQR